MVAEGSFKGSQSQSRGFGAKRGPKAYEEASAAKQAALGVQESFTESFTESFARAAGEPRRRRKKKALARALKKDQKSSGRLWERDLSPARRTKVKFQRTHPKSQGLFSKRIDILG
jgi:hypothetical protein